MFPHLENVNFQYIFYFEYFGYNYLETVVVVVKDLVSGFFFIDLVNSWLVSILGTEGQVHRGRRQGQNPGPGGEHVLLCTGRNDLTFSSCCFCSLDRNFL